MSIPAEVFLAETSLRADPDELATAAIRAFRAAGLGRRVRGLTAIKSHFGERGGDGFVPPAVIRGIVGEVRAAGGVPFLTDTTTLYTGRRTHAPDYLMLIHEHGFGIEAVGAPFVVADGLVGANEEEVAIDGVHHRSVAVAADALRADSAIVVSHVTGHLATGMGGTVKNLGMGFASRRGKLRQHSAMRPEIDAGTCTGCEACLPHCAGGALAMHGVGRGRTRRSVAAIDRGACTGCGECLASCRAGAVRFDWGVDSRRLQEAVAEHALGFVRRLGPRTGYLAFLTHVTRNCDCMGRREKPLFDDVGVLAGTDPVAIDQAALDLIRERTGESLEARAWPKLDAGLQLAHGERIGLGTRSYRRRPVAD